MDWNQLCQEPPGAITATTMTAMCNDAAAIAILGQPATALRLMIGMAQNLDFAEKQKKGGKKDKGGKADGIYFHLAVSLADKKGGALKPDTLLSDIVVEKLGAGECYESPFFKKVKARDGVLLMHQSLAPCTNCRRGYRALAMQRQMVVIVATDDGYDGSKVNDIFVFAPQGTIYLGQAS